MDDQTKAAFAGASECSKQIITLSTGLLALEITFAKSLLTTVSGAGKWLLGSSWILFLLAVMTGVWTLLALTGSLSAATSPTQRTIMDSNIRIPAIIQILLFLSGLALTVAFGIWVVW
jgi:hypothetical protein